MSRDHNHLPHGIPVLRSLALSLPLLTACLEPIHVRGCLLWVPKPKQGAAAQPPLGANPFQDLAKGFPVGFAAKQGLDEAEHFNEQCLKHPGAVPHPLPS